MGALNLVAPQGWLYVQQLAGADISPLGGNSGFDPTRTLPHRSDCCLYLPSGPFSSHHHHHHHHHHHKFHPDERQKATFCDGRHTFAWRAELRLSAHQQGSGADK